MDVLLTAKLKLQTTPEQFRALRQTQLAYRDALNHVSLYAFAQGRMRSAMSRVFSSPSTINAGSSASTA